MRLGRGGRRAIIAGGMRREKVVEVLVRPVKAMVVPEPVTERVLTYSG